MPDPGLEFRQGMPFFDMVGSFMIAIAGCPSIINADNPMKLDDSHYISIPGIITAGRHIRPREVHEQVAKGHVSQARFLKACCTMLANTAYEAVKPSNDLSPEFEFFRHIRNASAHRNRFHFLSHEPSRPSEWKGAVIDHTIKGASHPLHGSECFGTFIGAADIIDLLWEIERKIAI
ncbi:MAG: hypothetical protein AB7V39_20880 [Nitrospiraceae bacterium]